MDLALRVQFGNFLRKIDRLPVELQDFQVFRLDSQFLPIAFASLAWKGQASKSCQLFYWRRFLPNGWC